MSEIKKRRGRPKETGAKRKRIYLRVTDEQYDFFKEMSNLEGESLTDYFLESGRIRSNLTKSKHHIEEIEAVPNEDFMDEYYEEDYLEDD